MGILMSSYHFVWVIWPIVNNIKWIFKIYFHAVFTHVLTHIHIYAYSHDPLSHGNNTPTLRKCILVHITLYWEWNCQSSHLYYYSSCFSRATNPYLSGMLCTTWECVQLRAANVSCLLTGAVVGHLGYNTFIHIIKNVYILFLVDWAPIFWIGGIIPFTLDPFTNGSYASIHT